MKTLHILISRHYDFNQTHIVEMWLNAINPILSQHFSIKITWLLFFPEKNTQQIPNNVDVIHIQDFDNAVNIIETINPDLIISSEFPNLVDLALFAASMNSNTFFIKYNESLPSTSVSLKKTSNSVIIPKLIPFINSFHSLFVPANDVQNDKKNLFFYKSKFISYKMKFLLKTLTASKLKFSEKYNLFSVGLSHLVNPKLPHINSKLNADLEFCNTFSLYQLMCKKNYDSSKIFLVGNPIYDEFFKKRIKHETKKISEKIDVLFIPNSVPPKNTLKQVTQKLSENKDKFYFSVKLHPLSSVLESYQQQIHTIDKSIPIYQKGSVESYVELSDVILTSTVFASSLLYPLILQKPVIFCNFFNDVLPEDIEKIAFVCTDPNELQKVIFDACQNNYKKYEDIDIFLKSFCHSTDGNSAQRITDAVVSLVNQKSSN